MHITHSTIPGVEFVIEEQGHIKHAYAGINEIKRTFCSIVASTLDSDQSYHLESCNRHCRNSKCMAVDYILNTKHY